MIFNRQEGFTVENAEDAECTRGASAFGGKRFRKTQKINRRGVLLYAPTTKANRMLTKKQVLEKIQNGKSLEGVEIGDVDFSGDIFNTDANFKRAVFKGVANFRETKFEGKLDFSIADFQGEAVFTETQFQREANFLTAQFQKNAFFTGAHFQDNTFLSAAQFKEMADFDMTQFQKIAYFDMARFQGETIFDSAQFQDRTSFGFAQFQGETSFWDTQFQRQANFNYVTFFERVFFLSEKNARIFSSAFPTDMKFARFEKPEQVVFQSVDFSMCSFINTDLSKVELTDIIWPIKGVSFHFYSRNIVYDEIAEKPKKKNYPLVEKLYRDLKKNYENRGNYGEAGDFHYGEMEMRRLSRKGILRYASLLWLYKTLSGYGEKHWRALFWLGAFLLIYLGTYRFIEYNALSFRDGLWNSFVHALEVITFQRNHIYPSLSPQGKLADMFLTIAFSLQATLAILAIKRKFKR